MAPMPDLGAALPLGLGLVALGLLVATRATAWRGAMSALLLGAGAYNVCEGIGQIVASSGGDRTLLQFLGEVAYLPVLPAALGLALQLGGRRVGWPVWLLLALPMGVNLATSQVPDGAAAVLGPVGKWVSVVYLAAVCAVVLADLGRTASARSQPALGAVLLVACLPRLALYLEDLTRPASYADWRLAATGAVMLAALGASWAVLRNVATRDQDAVAALMRRATALCAVPAAVWALYAIPAFDAAAGGPIYSARWAMVLVAVWLAAREGAFAMGARARRRARLVFIAAAGCAGALTAAALAVALGLPTVPAHGVGWGLLLLAATAFVLLRDRVGADTA